MRGRGRAKGNNLVTCHAMYPTNPAASVREMLMYQHNSYENFCGEKLGAK